MSVLDVILGKPLASEEDSEQRVGVLAAYPHSGWMRWAPQLTGLSLRLRSSSLQQPRA